MSVTAQFTSIPLAPGVDPEEAERVLQAAMDQLAALRVGYCLTCKHPRQDHEPPGRPMAPNGRPCPGYVARQ